MIISAKAIATAVATTSLLVLWWTEPSLALSCNCGSSPCENPTCCPKGNELVSDACGCCKICARVEDESCGGPWNIEGLCGSGLSCLRQCECKTVQGLECVLPFKFKGKSFDKCTTEGSENGRPWCATTLDVSGEVIEGQWGDCAEGCPGTEFTCGDTDIFNKLGRCVPTARGEIEVNKALAYSLDPGATSPDPVAQCRTSDVNKCSCATLSGPASKDHAQRGEGCHESDRGLPGWCFLANVADPTDPTKDCYEDVIWSATNGRFWSSLACQDKSDLQAGDGLQGDPASPPPPPPTPSSEPPQAYR